MSAAFLALAFALSPPPDPPALAGTWVLVKASADLPDGVKFVLDFAAGGALTLRFETGDPKRDAAHKGRYKLDGKKLTYTLTTGAGERSETLTVKALTADELVLIDADNKREEFKREK